jgi:hypothetical protein
MIARQATAGRSLVANHKEGGPKLWAGAVSLSLLFCKTGRQRQGSLLPHPRTRMVI